MEYDKEKLMKLMKERCQPIKNKTCIFRASESTLETLDKIAKSIGTTRSELIRRLIEICEQALKE